MIVYKITNTVNGKIYLGITVYGLDFRMNGHMNDMRRGKKSYLHSAMRKYGADSFSWEVIDQTECFEELNRLEIGYIQIYGSMNPDIGYNMTIGGGGSFGFKHDDEAKAKMSVIQKGRPRTKEDRDRTSRTFKGVPKSEDHRRKISEGNSGQPKSAEHRSKLSAALAGRARPDLAGEKHGQSKLSDIQRHEIFGRYVFGTESQKAIASDYKVSQCTAWKAIKFVRKQLPQQVVTREDYEKYSGRLKPIDLESSEGIVSEIEDDCATGACPVR